MRATRTLVLWAVLALLPASAAAVTTDQIVALKKAGVTDAVIVALIDRDHTVFSLQPEQIVALQREGLSEAVIIAMLKSGQAGEDALRAESAYASATVAAAIAPGPEVLIVGHGPDRPNTYHADGFFSNGNPSYLFPPFGRYGSYEPPYVGVGEVPYIATPRFAGRDDQRVRPRALCYAQVASGPSRTNALTMLTECPPVLQPSRRFAR